MLAQFQDIISFIGYTLEAFGVALIVFGAIRALFHASTRLGSADKDALFVGFRREIGRAMLLGLEFLVAGDIIRTVVVVNSVSEVLSLGLVVVIRTVLVFTIHLEVEGRWPWQQAEPRPL